MLLHRCSIRDLRLADVSDHCECASWFHGDCASDHGDCASWFISVTVVCTDLIVRVGFMARLCELVSWRDCDVHLMALRYDYCDLVKDVTGTKSHYGMPNVAHKA